LIGERFEARTRKWVAAPEYGRLFQAWTSLVRIPLLRFNAKQKGAGAPLSQPEGGPGFLFSSLLRKLETYN